MIAPEGVVSIAACMLALGVAIGVKVSDAQGNVGERPTSYAVSMTAIQSDRTNERYTDLAPILLPESTIRASGGSSIFRVAGAEIVIAAIVDTSGSIEATSVQILSAPDSTTARAVRAGIGGIRYIPARVVLDVEECVRFNGANGHCGGATPAVRPLRARVVLRIEAFKPQSVPR